tara:strand:- start:601 stop:765 length:165 start_codon:yes stop_codon:yes gene_type:complete
MPFLNHKCAARACAFPEVHQHLRDGRLGGLLGEEKQQHKLALVKQLTSPAFAVE